MLRDNCVDFFPLSSINNGHTLSDNLFIRLSFKVMLHETICNDDFKRDTALQIVATLFRMVITLFQHCNAMLVTLKIVVANRPVYHASPLVAK